MVSCLSELWWGMASWWAVRWWGVGEHVVVWWCVEVMGELKVGCGCMVVRCGWACGWGRLHGEVWRRHWALYGQYESYGMGVVHGWRCGWCAGCGRAVYELCAGCVQAITFKNQSYSNSRSHLLHIYHTTTNLQLGFHRVFFSQTPLAEMSWTIWEKNFVETKLKIGTSMVCVTDEASSLNEIDVVFLECFWLLPLTSTER